MLDTKMIIYEGNVIEMFLRKSVLRLEYQNQFYSTTKQNGYG